jgi:hypothetical protein
VCLCAEKSGKSWSREPSRKSTQDDTAGGATDEGGGGLVTRTHSTATLVETAEAERAHANMMSVNLIGLVVGTTSINAQHACQTQSKQACSKVQTGPSIYRRRSLMTRFSTTVALLRA